MSQKILLYVGNHDKKGIIDYIHFFKTILKSKLVISNKISDDFKSIIIIENFTNIFQLIKIYFFLKKFNGKKILVITEFLREIKKKLVFNTFDETYAKKIIISKNIFSKVFFFLFFFMFFYTTFFFNKVIFTCRFKKKKYFKKIYIFKKIIKIYKKIINFFSSNYITCYFYFRLLTFLIIKNSFNFYLLSHENLISKKLIKKYNLEKYSIIKWSARMKKIKTNKQFVINFSGGVSSYRINILEKIRYNKKIFKNLINKNLINKSFVKSEMNKNSLVFSLHPKKTSNWKHSSPTRYLNSIKKGEIPIIMDKFNDRYIDLALTDDLLLFKSKRKIVDTIRKYRKKINKLDLHLKKKNLRVF